MFRSPEREAFLRAALRSLRPGRARAALERELRDHMDDAAEAYRAQGLPPEEAEARAVASMGDPKALARQIRQAHRPAAPVGALVLLAAMGAASAVLQTASQGPGALASRLLALALGGALGAAALCLDARRAARWAAPLLGGLLLAFLAAAALTPRISGSYPPVDALAALLAPGLGLLAGCLRLRRGGAILLGAAALGAMALCAALGSRAGALPGRLRQRWPWAARWPRSSCTPTDRPRRRSSSTSKIPCAPCSKAISPPGRKWPGRATTCWRA